MVSSLVTTCIDNVVCSIEESVRICVCVCVCVCVKERERERERDVHELNWNETKQTQSQNFRHINRMYICPYLLTHLASVKFS